MHTSSADWRAADECIGAGHEALSLDELLSVLAPRLCTIFQADLVMWTTYGADMGVTGYRMSPEIKVDHLFAPFLELFCEHPWHAQFAKILPRGQASFLSDYMPVRDLLRTGLWNEVYIHLYSKHQISVGGPMDASNYFTFGINRLGRAYGPRERQLIHFMRPKIEVLIQRSTRAVQTRHFADTLQQFFAQGDNAYAWVGRDGAIREISPAANRLFGASLASDAGALKIILAALHRLQGKGGRSRRFVSVRIGTMDGLLLSLGPTDGAVLLLEPPNKSIPTEKAPLTRREAEVLHWIGEGKSNRETGALLGISFRTVERHGENLFAKLGVESRYAAAMVARDHHEGV